jgi:hypothetical protein
MVISSGQGITRSLEPGYLGRWFMVLSFVALTFGPSWLEVGTGTSHKDTLDMRKTRFVNDE